MRFVEYIQGVELSHLFAKQWQYLLLSWYEVHRRCLPWRDISDPYCIWVSEIILQQSRIAQGVGYYQRFIQVFPTVEVLAKAEEDDVMQVWQGLGYYSRARNMQSAARSIVEMGGFPQDYAGVRSLKGVGDYTAAAICSFAYGLPYAVVDGNVYRVLSRYFGIETPIDTTQGKKLFSSLAQALIPFRLIADYNQAIMDFGAMQCTPVSPNCSICPLSDGCCALAGGSVDKLPVKNHHTSVKNRYFVYFIIETPEGVWLHRRGKGDIWNGLYEFPMTEFASPVDAQEALHTPFVESLPAEFTFTIVAKGVKHILTHRCIQADCYRFQFSQSIQVPKQYLSVKHADFGLYAVPRLVEKLWLRALES